MVVYDLQCAGGHRFEGWFGDLKDLKAQLKKGLVTCPMCGNEKVRQVPAGFAIAKTGRPAPVADDGDAQAMAPLLHKAMNRYLRENFDDVGPGFAKEALKIHYGVSESRNIRGVSTPEEEKVLKDEGVSFFKVAAKPAEAAGEGEED